MSCYHPLRAVVLGLNENGKKKIKILPHNDPSLNLDCAEYIQIPCGHCIGCRLDKSRDWANRCMLEAKYHEKMCFLTLTYDDDHLPPQKLKIARLRSNPRVTGILPHITDKKLLNREICRFMTHSTRHSLVKKDLQDFMKRLRRDFEYHDGITGIRFFACGEYGSKTFRPHFHVLLYGVDFAEDRRLYKANFQGDNLYNSERLSKLWTFGHAVVADLTWNTCAYVARYVVKKQYGEGSKIYEQENYEPEFTVMSRRPGIGRKYYDDNADEIYKFDEIFLSDIKKGAMTIKPPRYYDKLYDIDSPDVMYAVRDTRKKVAEQSLYDEMRKTDKDFIDYMAVKEYNHMRKSSFIANEREVMI